MVNYINPGILGPPEVFRSLFQTPIERGRDKNADAEDRVLGRARSIELAKITRKFILRRTSKVNEKYLPDKTELTVTCRLTDDQARLYRFIADARKAGLKSKDMKPGEKKKDAQALSAIILLKKLW